MPSYPKIPNKSGNLFYHHHPFLCSAEDDLRDVCKEVVSIQSTYYRFGIALGLRAGVLDSIRKAFHHVIDQAFDEVLLVWLRQRYDIERHGPPTWRRLVEAVDSPNGGNHPALAVDIAHRHPIPSMLSPPLFLSPPTHPPSLSLSSLKHTHMQRSLRFIYTCTHSSHRTAGKIGGH